MRLCTSQHSGIIEHVLKTVALFLTVGLGEKYRQEAFGCVVHAYNKIFLNLKLSFAKHHRHLMQSYHMSQIGKSHEGYGQTCVQ